MPDPVAATGRASAVDWNNCSLVKSSTTASDKIDLVVVISKLGYGLLYNYSYSKDCLSQDCCTVLVMISTNEATPFYTDDNFEETDEELIILRKTIKPEAIQIYTDIINTARIADKSF